jgi:MoaA/NifB/PqqE/SkfB family radical SAM enzyme
MMMTKLNQKTKLASPKAGTSITEWDDDINPFNSLKVLCYSKKIESIIGGQIPSPVTVNIDLSNVCNHDCEWCFSREYNANSPCMMSKSMASNIIDDLVKLNVKSVILSGGGEPVTNPHFEFVVNSLTKNNIAVGLNTNGSLLHKVKLNILCNLTYIRVSLDGGKNTHCKLHNTNDSKSFDKIVRNLRIICFNKPTNLTVGIGYLIHESNINEIFDTCKLMKKCGVSYFEVRPIKYNALSKEDKAKLVQINKACLAIQDDKFKVYFVMHKESNKDVKKSPRKDCYMCKMVSTISPNGMVYPCCELRGRNVLADLKEQTFANFWNSKKHKELLSDINFSQCPACKFSKQNKIIESAFINNNMHKEFL